MTKQATNNSREFKDFEAAFMRARGVGRVHVSRDSKGAVKLNVVATGERSPKQIVRDLKSIAQIDFSTELDHRFISIVEPRGQGDLEEDALRKFRRSKRILIADVSSQDGTATVNLSRGPTEAISQESTDNGEHEAVAKATIASLREIDKGFGRISFNTATVVETGKGRTALVTVSIGEGDDTQVAAGCAVIREAGELVAVSRAVLDAVNRRIAQSS